MAPLFDAHNHLQDEWLVPHRERICADLAAVGVCACVVNGTSESDWSEVAELCGNTTSGNAGTLSQLSALKSQLSSPSPKPETQNPKPKLLASFGLHPWDVGNRTPAWREKLIGVLDANPNAYIGEIGLDRWMTDRAKPDDPRLAGLRRAPLGEQLEIFHTQLAIAAERNLPTTIHCLDAFGALLDTLQKGPVPQCGFLLHAYSGPAEMVTSFAKLGGYFSFNGAFVEPRKERLRDVFAIVPADRLLVETDAPAMGLPDDRARFHLPTAGGNRVNHPANLIIAYEGLAAVRGLSADALAEQVAANFRRLFGP